MLAFLLPFHLQRELALGPAQAGAFMTAQPAMMAVVAPVSGMIADRWGPRLPSVAGMLAIAAGIACVSTSAAAPGVWLVLSLALVGLGAGLYVAPNSALIMGAAPRDRQSTAAAMAATARNLGMTLGIAIAASLDHAIGFRSALLVAAALGALGAAFGLARPVTS
jgi:DHA2 family multidrug resistance protein-like MFS transporter